MDIEDSKEKETPEQKIDPRIFKTDLVLTSLLLTLLIIESLSADMSVPVQAVINITMLYCKLPFLVLLCLYHAAKKPESSIKKQIYPRSSNLNFLTYKDKVVHLISTFLRQYKKQS